MRSDKDRQTSFADSVTALLDQPVEVVEMLSDDDRRNRIARLKITGGRHRGTTVIAKQTVGFDDPGAEDHLRVRLFSEAVATTMLTRLDAGIHTARCRGVDTQRGLMVFDDLGSSATLVQSLMHETGPAARAALIGYVRRLGAIHAATAGQLQAWDDVAADLGAPDYLRSQRRLQLDAEAIDRGLTGLDQLLRDLGIPVIGTDSELMSEFASVRTAMTDPGPFTVLVHRDPCPDNVVLTESGVRLIDFEFSYPGHALIDGLYPQLPFPTCWCCNTVPDDLRAELAAAYRQELITGVPEAADDDLYLDATAMVMAYWLITSFEWMFSDVLSESRNWGIASTRSRVLSRLLAFADQSSETGRLPALGRLTREIQRVLTDRWAPEGPLPVYPAFRSGR